MSTQISCDNGVSQASQNPLLEQWETPFGIAPFDRIEAQHYLGAFSVAFEEQRADIERIVKNEDEPTFENVIYALDQSGIRLSELNDLFEMSSAAISTAEYHAVSEQLMPLISAANDSVWMNEELFERVEAVYERRGEMELDEVQRRLVDKMYTKFIRGGAGCNAELKGQLAAINAEIATLSSRFSNNLIIENDSFILDLNAKEVASLPQEVKSAASDEARRRGLKDRWVFSLSPSSMVPFLTYSKERALREKLYRAYLSRGANGGESDNREIVKRVSELRQQRAKILGYENHAEYVISQQMAGSASAAYELLDKIWTPALERAEEERDELQKLLIKDHEDATLEPWDWWYYAEKLRLSRYDISMETLRQYFQLESVRAGAFTLANRLFGILFRPVDVPHYDQTCLAYEVLDRDGTHLGVLYFDLFARSTKGQGAWCGNLRQQRSEGPDRITPVVAVVCNFPPATLTAPSLLTVEQVETLFHEFGHALHFLFQNVDYRGLADVEGDFVEFPSQVMENWALEPSLLMHYAVNHRTGKVIDGSLIRKLESSRLFNQGYETLSLTAAALLDLDLQTLTNLEGFDIESFEREVLRTKRGLIAEIEPRYHLPYFAHLFTYDYSAGYYFYLWAEVLDKDCFALFKQSGDVFSKSLADRLRREVLSRGGEADGMTLYRNFKGEDPTQYPMLVSRGLMSQEEANAILNPEEGEEQIEVVDEVEEQDENILIE
ncbi:MAG: M3 family metallopeptidase [Rikenellaceae bacterium]